MQSFTDLLYRFIICSPPLAPPLLLLFLPKVVAIVTRYVHLQKWQKVFHLSSLLCIHKEEWSKQQAGAGVAYFMP